MVGPHAVDPPARMVPARHRIRVGRGDQRIAFTQKPAQTSIDEASLRTAMRIMLGSFDRLVDQRKYFVGGLLRVPGQGRNDAEL